MRIASLLLLAFLVAASGCGDDDGGTTGGSGTGSGTTGTGDTTGDDDPIGDSTLVIANESSFFIIEINVSPVSETTFGPDLLGDDVLEPGEALEVTLECDDYDIRVVDEDEVECILFEIDLCFEDAVWEITDDVLLSCAFE